MTDKEKIRAEVERRLSKNMNKAKSGGCLHTIAAKEDEEILSFIDSLPKDPVNEDLEQAIDKYLNNGMALRLDWKKCDISFSASQLIKFSNYIAQWQKEQMIK